MNTVEAVTLCLRLYHKAEGERTTFIDLLCAETGIPTENASVIYDLVQDHQFRETELKQRYPHLYKLDCDLKDLKAANQLSWTVRGTMVFVVIVVVACVIRVFTG